MPSKGRPLHVREIARLRPRTITTLAIIIHDENLVSCEADADGRIAFRTAGIFGIKIRDQLDREIAFSAM